MTQIFATIRELGDIFASKASFNKFISEASDVTVKKYAASLKGIGENLAGVGITAEMANDTFTVLEVMESVIAKSAHIENLVKDSIPILDFSDSKDCPILSRIIDELNCVLVRIELLLKSNLNAYPSGKFAIPKSLDDLLNTFIPLIELYQGQPKTHFEKDRFFRKFEEGLIEAQIQSFLNQIRPIENWLVDLLVHFWQEVYLLINRLLMAYCRYLGRHDWLVEESTGKLSVRLFKHRLLCDTHRKMFLEIEQICINQGLLEFSKDCLLHWKGQKGDLVILLYHLIKEKYFIRANLTNPEEHPKVLKVREFIEKRYHTDIRTQFEQVRRDKYIAEHNEQNNLIYIWVSGVSNHKGG